MRRVQPFAAQQLADLTRTGARISLGKDLRLVLGGERAALGLLDQLWIRDLPGTADPLGRGAPAGPESQLSYAKLVFAAGGSSLNRCSSSIRARLHVRRAPFSPSRFIDSSMVSASPDVDREGPAPSTTG